MSSRANNSVNFQLIFTNKVSKSTLRFFIQGIPFAIKTIWIWNHDCFDCHREWNSEEPLRCVVISFSFDFIFRHSISMSSEPVELSRVRFPAKLSKASLGFVQTIKTSKVDRWFGLIGNQDCNQTKGTSFIAMEPHFGCNPDCSGYERNAMIICWFTWPAAMPDFRTKLFFSKLVHIFFFGGGGGGGGHLVGCIDLLRQ